MATTLVEKLREDIRKIAVSVRSGQECRLERRRPVKNPERSVRSIRILLARALLHEPLPSSGVSTQEEESIRCLYREFLVDGAIGPVCDTPLLGGSPGKLRLYCRRHSFMCEGKYCANFVDRDGAWCSQCRRAQYGEGHVIRLSA